MTDSKRVGNSTQQAAGEQTRSDEKLLIKRSPEGGGRRALGSDLGAHEYNVRDAETNRDEPKQRCDVWPDQPEALVDRQRRCQDSFGLARKNPTKGPTGCRVEENLNAFLKKSAWGDTSHGIGDVHLARDGLRGGGVRHGDVRYGQSQNWNKQQHKQPH